MNVTLHLAICGVLVFFLIASFLYRKFIDDHDDHNIHLTNTVSNGRILTSQVEHARRIEVLDKLNKYLSVVIILYLIAIGLMAAYSGWFANQAL